MNNDQIIITRHPDGGSFSVSAASDDQLLRQQLALFVSHIPRALATAFILAVISTFVFWHVMPQSQLVAWILAIAAVSGARLVLVSVFDSENYTLDACHKWLHAYNLCTCLSGAIWGVAALQLDPAWPLEHQAFLLFALAGLTAGAISTHAVILKTYLLFLLPVTLPLALSLLVQGSSLHISLGMMIAVYTLAMSVIASIHSRAIRQSFALGYENQRLVSGLTETNENLRQEVKQKQAAMDQLRREQRLFFEGPVVTYRIYKSGNCVIDYISRTVRQFGLDPDQLMREGTEFTSLIHPDDRDRADKTEYFQQDNSDLTVLEIDYRLMLPNGEIRWVYDCSILARDDKGDEFYDGYLIDITSRKHIEQALFEEKERIQVTLQSIGDGVITTDSDDRIRFMNPAAEALTGWPIADAQGRPVSEVFRLVDDGNQRKREEGERRRQQSGKFWNTLGDHQLLSRRDGGLFYGKSVTSPIEGANGENYGSVIVFHDVTEQRKLTEHLSYQARHDPLTGLINRREFEWVLETALATAKEQDCVHSLCYIDLDQFKIVNDTCGHDAGDELLKQLAYGMTQLLRETDVLARLGGDEFGLLLEGCSEQNAYTIGEKIRKYIKDNRFVWDDKVFEVGASIGIVGIKPDSETIGKLLSAADIACYAAKDHGRNQVHVYQGEESEPAKRHSEIQLVTHITRALEEDTLSLYYQEIRSLKGDALAGPYGEILVRMKDEQGGIVSPGLFIPAAERYNLMPAIDLWVIRKTLEWCQDKLEKNIAIGRLSVNLSGHSLGCQHFCSDVIRLFAQYDVSPGYLCFEITETAAISNFSSASQFIRRLKERGCRFALDDFGSGLSSFSYLKNLAVDFLKIDGCFIKDIVEDPIDHEMVKSIHQLGMVMGMQTIAEFVENDEILAAIRAIGIDYAQGYGIAKPVPIETALAGQVAPREACSVS